jgi:ABC-type multidrug transport system fused ATPase/permease subunit
VKRADYDPSIAGISLTYSFLFPYFLLYFSFNYSFMKIFLLSLERLLEYCNPNAGHDMADSSNSSNIVPQEPAWYLPNDSKKDPKKPISTDKTAGVGSQWPRGGAICFTDVVMSYRPDLPPALNRVTFSVHAHEKVGIVGRTGAGKSTLALLLFRIVDAQAGSVTVDGRDITTLGLQTLRQCMGIIPQQPLLLSGSVQHNLDPFDGHDYETLEAVMVKVGLPIKLLRTEVTSEGGTSSLSAGQQQLVSFARVLLRRIAEPEGLPVVVMDEPTSNIDKETDNKLQRLVRAELEDATVMTIAHRLNTVIDFNKILVMGAGKVLEFDSPANLLQNPEGELSRMADALGPEAAAALKSKAHF